MRSSSEPGSSRATPAVSEDDEAEKKPLKKKRRTPKKTIKSQGRALRNYDKDVRPPDGKKGDKLGYIIRSTDRSRTALYSGHRELKRFHYERLPHKYHGSGCTLASSLAALIAQGHDEVSACHKALDYTYQTLVNASRLGMGQHHPNRFYWMDKFNQ